MSEQQPESKGHGDAPVRQSGEPEIPDRSQFLRGGRVGVLLIHGLGGTPVEMRFVAQNMARIGHTVYCCQLAGHCGTPEELRRSTWQQWYASVEAAHDRLREDGDVDISSKSSLLSLGFSKSFL